MQSDQDKWNLRHKNNPIPSEPLALLRQFITAAPRGKALDIACGMGRNSRFMRDCGFEVESIDISDFAITSLQMNAIFTRIAQIWILLRFCHKTIILFAIAIF